MINLTVEQIFKDDQLCDYCSKPILGSNFAGYRAIKIPLIKHKTVQIVHIICDDCEVEMLNLLESYNLIFE